MLHLGLNVENAHQMYWKMKNQEMNMIYAIKKFMKITFHQKMKEKLNKLLTKLY